MNLARLSIIILTFTLLISSYSSAWVIQTVDNADPTTTHDPSITVDSANTVHISYCDQGPNDLLHATNASGSWTSETVATDNFVGNYSSISVDSADKVHICSVEYGPGSGGPDMVKYTTNVSGSWVTEVVDTQATNAVARHTSIQTDSANKAHVGYSYYSSDLDRFVVGYATNASGSWVRETVDDFDVAGCRFVLDSADKAHFVYNNYPDYSRSYATNKSGVWEKEVLVAESGGNPSIAVDSADNVHVIAPVYPQVKHISNATGSWVTEILPSHIVGCDGMVIDSSNRMHITFDSIGPNPGSENILKYSTNATGTWQTETVDSIEASSYRARLAVDSSNKVHIAYDRFEEWDLMYATNAPACSDSDGDGYGNPGDPECPGGLLQDCDDFNQHVYPTNSNTYCNCEEPYVDGVAENSAAGNCSDGIDNDCDGLIDTDPECCVSGPCAPCD